MTTTELLQLDWPELELELCKELNEALENPGPWKHVRYSGKRLDPQRCVLCDQHWSSWDEWMRAKDDTKCPVPPPITLEPEVVAERLAKLVPVRSNGRAFLGTLDGVFTPGEVRALLKDWHSSDEETNVLYWFAVIATPTQRIVVCLLTLGMLETT